MTSTKKHKKKKVLKSDAPAVVVPSFVPDFVTPAGVEAISIDHPCQECGEKWSDHRLTIGAGEDSAPLRFVRYLVSDIIWPAVAGRDIWPVRPDVLWAWLCPACFDAARAQGMEVWAWDRRATFADKAWKKKRSGGVAETFRERFDAAEDDWAQERWDASVREECREQLEAAYGVSPSAIAIQAAGVIHREYNTRLVDRELPSEELSDLRREARRAREAEIRKGFEIIEAAAEAEIAKNGNPHS